MPTSFETIIDIALTQVDDYRLDNLYSTNPTAWETFVNGIMISAAPLFTNCEKSLMVIDGNSFEGTLSNVEISILADLWVYQWWIRNVNDYLQNADNLTDTDFKHHSKANNLNTRILERDKKREEVYTRMTEYGYNNVDWSNLANGNFFN